MTDAALVKLRLSEPDLPRPYRISIGVPGLCVLFLPPIALSCALAYLAETATLVATGGVLVLGVVAHVVRRFVRGPEGLMNDGESNWLDLSAAAKTCLTCTVAQYATSQHLCESVLFRLRVV